MKNIALMLLVSAAILLYGCAQAPQQAQPALQAQANFPKPAEAPQQPPALPVQNASPSPGPTQPPQAQPANCSVQFQKDTSNIYYVMVTPLQDGTSVSCPNGKSAQRQGELYFCSQLDASGPTIAYFNGTECGRAAFSKDALSASSPGKQSCTVLLSPSRITAGQTSTVTVKAYVPQERSNLSYLCGDAEASQSAGGMVDTGKICQFSKPGTVEVYAKVNGEVCATSILTVFSTPKDCSVYNATLAMDRGQYVYSAKVAARGYSGSDELRYTCYDVPYGIRLNTIPNTTDFVTTIECRSASGPLSGNVPVRVGGDACGEMEIPS